MACGLLMKHLLTIHVSQLQSFTYNEYAIMQMRYEKTALQLYDIISNITRNTDFVTLVCIIEPGHEISNNVVF